MAAYAALVSLFNDLELIPNHPTHSFSFDTKQISFLSQTVDFLIDFMDTYDSHACSREVAEVLEGRIASAAHAAHDVMESHVVDQILAGSTLCGKHKSYFLLDLQKAIEGMEFVKRKAMKFQAESGLRAEQSTYSELPASSEPLSSSKNLMVGFDVVVLRLMEMLTAESSSRQVIPIVGMGGMGKTTLAKNVYHHLLIEHHFDVRLWATISQDYSVGSVLTELLYGVRKSTNDSVLGLKLHKMLWGRRYLIVLDDMWSERAWNEVQMFLPDSGNGSCVIVTTRLSYLAAHLSSLPFDMDFLDEDKSWELFCGKAFGDESCPVELEEIGKKIVKRCRGLPLSIVVIGGHLRRSSRAIEGWEKVANYINPISSIGAEDQCLKVISLSYEHLPACLKPCFLYIGIYEEDDGIHSTELFKYWVAEGFLKAKKGLCLEELAEDYLEDLIDRNLIIVRDRKWNGKVQMCIIHDIVREFCLKVANKEKFLCVLNTTKAIGRERRIVIPRGTPKFDIVGALKSAPLLRSLIPRGRRLYFEELPLELRLLRLFRITNDTYMKKDDGCLPTSDVQQVNLRYFAVYFKGNFVRRDFIEFPYFSPSSISQLWNIQTLIIMYHLDFQMAPDEIWEMTQLQHLHLDRICLPDLIPSERSKQHECIVLHNLRTLFGVVNFKLTEEVCRRIPNLKQLSVGYDYIPRGCEPTSYYCLHNLARFSKLELLRCSFSGDSKWRDIALSLRFPTSLEELSLGNGHLYWKDLRMMMKSLSHLGSLELQSVRGPEWDLVDEEFPSLKVLRFFWCDDLMRWNANSSHFPVLEHLDIWGAHKLSEIPFDIGEISTLKFIDVRDCGAPVAVSAMRIVAEQESLGNHDLRLDVVFSKREEYETFQKMVEEEGLTSKNLHLRSNPLLSRRK